MFNRLKNKISSFTNKMQAGLEKKAVEESVLPEEKKEEFKEEIEKAKEKHEEEIAKKNLEEETVSEPIEKDLEVSEENLAGLDEKIKDFSEEIPESEEPEEKKEIEEADKEIVAEEKGIEGISDTLKALKEEKGRELKASIGVGKKLGMLVKSITVEENDIEDFLWEFELALLESDVEQETAKDIVEEIKKELVGKKVGRGQDISEFLKTEIKLVLKKIMEEAEEINLMEMIEKNKPLTILILGSNGHGKTTTIAKLTKMLKEKGKEVILASADTFRAGSIEQLEEHGRRLGVRVVKHKYGSDPAAVAFDAKKAAESGKADIVLIDSAGRQETNVNLMNELKKIDRVINPDLKIFVGESLSGNTLLEQAKKFNEELHIDGFILTKIDCDTKGGTAISILYKLKKPILFLGVGQAYEDLIEFTPAFILDRIFS